LPVGRCLSDTDRLTEERVRELINLKEIRATKIARWRIRPKDLEEFIRARTNK
jgi:hypothetical protein